MTRPWQGLPWRLRAVAFVGFGVWFVGTLVLRAGERILSAADLMERVDTGAQHKQTPVAPRAPVGVGITWCIIVLGALASAGAYLWFKGAS
jgi:hypothetical protein